MDQIRFDGQVAIVTGAGRGMGRAHAQLLASRGATVVVNDLGGESDGTGRDPSVAEAVASELRESGASAIADDSDVASVLDVERLVERTMERYGRIDILVNNAGMLAPQPFPDISDDNMARHLEVHFVGTFNVTRACWPYMAEVGYGRIVMTTSHTITGYEDMAPYASAKAAVFTLARTLALSGNPIGIKVNSIAPFALTRLAGLTGGSTTLENTTELELKERHPDLVAPLAVLLCHQSCPVTGESFMSGGRRAARIAVIETQGYVHPDFDVTPETVAANWDQIMDPTRHYLVPDTTWWSMKNDSFIHPPATRG